MEAPTGVYWIDMGELGVNVTVGPDTVAVVGLDVRVVV